MGSHQRVWDCWSQVSVWTHLSNTLQPPHPLFLKEEIYELYSLLSIWYRCNFVVFGCLITVGMRLEVHHKSTLLQSTFIILKTSHFTLCSFYTADSSILLKEKTTLFWTKASYLICAWLLVSQLEKHNDDLEYDLCGWGRMTLLCRKALCGWTTLIQKGHIAAR